MQQIAFRSTGTCFLRLVSSSKDWVEHRHRRSQWRRPFANHHQRKSPSYTLTSSKPLYFSRLLKMIIPFFSLLKSAPVIAMFVSTFLVDTWTTTASSLVSIHSESLQMARLSRQDYELYLRGTVSRKENDIFRYEFPVERWTSTCELNSMQTSDAFSLSTIKGLLNSIEPAYSKHCSLNTPCWRLIYLSQNLLSATLIRCRRFRSYSYTWKNAIVCNNITRFTWFKCLLQFPQIISHKRDRPL